MPGFDPSPSVKIMGRKVGLRCKGKTLLGVVNILFCIKTKKSNVHNFLKVMGSNPGYLFKASLIYTINTNFTNTGFYNSLLNT